METTATASTREKRKAENQLVDPDTGIRISTGKKIMAEVDKDKKLRVLIFILSSYYKLYTLAFKKNADRYKNITVGCQLTNIVFSAHNILRQRTAETIGNQELKANELTEFQLKII